MLILTRSIDQSIFIGEEIAVKVLAVKGDKVRIGIVAPKETTVHRGGTYESLMDEGKERIETDR
jgi:carbon storage regulator